MYNNKIMDTWFRVLFTAVAASAFIESSAFGVDDCGDVRYSNGPLIKPCNNEIILKKGDNLTFTCKGKNKIKFRQQEGPEEIIGDFNITIIHSTIDDDGEFRYKVDLVLSNVDRFAIGYYACFFDDNVDEENDELYNKYLNNLVAEPSNSENVTYFYVYVDGTDSLYAPMRELIMPKADMVVIECRPTTPDVEVNLTVVCIPTSNRRGPLVLEDIPESASKRYSPKIGFTLVNKVLADRFGISILSCGFSKDDRWDSKDVFVKRIEAPPEPNLGLPDLKRRNNAHTPIIPKKWYLKGESFTLNCTVDYQINFVVKLQWEYPNKKRTNIIHMNNENELVSGNVLYHNITIVNATKEDEGTYTCISSNNCEKKEKSVNMNYYDKPILELTDSNYNKGSKVMFSRQRSVGLIYEIEDYPAATHYFMLNNKKMSTENGNKYKVIESERFQGSNKRTVELKILNANVTDTGNYTMVAQNGYLSERFTFVLMYQATPVIDYFQDTTCVEGMSATLLCRASGFPLPTVTFSFNGSEDMLCTRSSADSQYNVTAYMDIPKCMNSGKITCRAENKINRNINSTSLTRNLFLYEIPNGFGIVLPSNSDKVLWYHEDDSVNLKCLASKYFYDSVTWIADDSNNVTNVSKNVVYSTSEHSIIASLKISNISVSETGTYICRGRKNGKIQEDVVTINVEELRNPIIAEADGDQDINANRYQPVQLECQAEGVPKPKVTWFKDGILLENSTDAKIVYYEKDRNLVISTIDIASMQQELDGKYECVAENYLNRDVKTYTLMLQKEPITTYLIAIIVIIFVLSSLVCYLCWKVKKEKKFRKELAAAGLLYFKEGVTKSLNPELGIDEQAELLPYDDRFEFSSEKLKLGKQLGAGAFGVVYKAEARGIVNAEETTLVAVKMVKKTADNMYIKALASELKIMVHLGRHINIVNLLGACTKNVGKRELSVIVEYCKFGNIHNYIMRHRDVFIDQLTDSNKEKNLGKINQAYSCTGSSGTPSDYYGCTNTQETDNTFVHTGYTNRSGRKNVAKNIQPVETPKASEGYVVQPEWRSTYETDYSDYDGRTPRPLTSRDLLAWAFQIARGMEYLASRKVLHGDLAARNVLLAEDNVVKICDFGLARSIYKNDEYQKQENSPLPVKWLAIECMTDRIFSTQSDVWSFGIVLWELFSLAKTPYPNISPTNLLQFLTEGHRLDKPANADDRLYDVMKKCWEQKPTARPSFTQLQEILGTFLEDNVRNHYVDLNSAFAEKNPIATDHEDYLAMVSAPDYNNMVTPSPHHYVNEAKSFFPPTPSKVDEEGYLQMSPASAQSVFSPRPASTKFDFDPRKCNSRPSEASHYGSELTPMLNLNNLPTRSGSESDHDGNAPYLNMCPRIEEETDEVFDTRQNNAKNAATNLMYITLDKDIEKKPNINYVNINVPNGLVK